MMNLLCRSEGLVLRCTDCEEEWPIDEAQAFVTQLRDVASRHPCTSTSADEIEPHLRRVTHLRVVR
jgi:hypothetical protein